jgi:hypothetical protein
MHSIVTISIACFLTVSTSAEERTVAPTNAKTTRAVIKAVERSKGFALCIETAQFNRCGRQVFAVWYCPFSGRAACYLHAYYYDHAKARWLRLTGI